MEERNISKQAIEETIEEPEQVLTGDGESEVAERRYGKQIIKVAFEELKRKTKTIKIISVWKKKLKR